MGIITDMIVMNYIMHLQKIGERWNPTLYFLKPRGEQLVQLMYYFKNYYENKKN
jgi:hypothetical protein